MNVTDVLHLALERHLASDHETAENLYRQVLEKEPLNANARHLLGCVLLREHNIDDAIASIGAAISISPVAQFYSSLGACYLEKGEHVAAGFCFRHALELDRSNIDAWANLGLMHIRAGRFGEARDVLEQANDLFPSHQTILCNLGHVYVELERVTDALAMYRRAAQSNPSAVSAILGIAECLSNLHQNEAALAIIDQIAAPGPTFNENSLPKKGRILEVLGRLDEARAYYDAALRFMPADADLLLARAYIQKVSRDEPFFNQLTQFEQQADHMRGAARSKLYYALGKAYLDVGDIATAAKRYATGAANHLVMSSQYREQEDEAYCTSMLSNVTAAYLGGMQIIGNESDRPIFVLGMPRSGTTLIEQILASHPEVFAGGEVPLAINALQGMRFPGGWQLGESSAQSLPEDATLRQRADAYLSKMAEISGSSEKRFFTDKMPANYFNLGLLVAMFPNARIIHCRRDPVDTCISNYTTLFGRHHHWSFDFGMLGRTYRRYWDLMQHWRNILPGRFLEVRYEQVVENPEQLSRTILQWCGLEWDEQVLRYYESDRPVLTASVAQVRRPIFHSSIGRSKIWEPYIQPLLAEIGDIQKQYWAELDDQGKPPDGLRPMQENTDASRAPVVASRFQIFKRLPAFKMRRLVGP